MAKKYNLYFVDTPRIFIIAKLSIRKPGSLSVLIISKLFKFTQSLLCYKRRAQCIHVACKLINNFERNDVILINACARKTSEISFAH